MSALLTYLYTEGMRPFFAQLDALQRQLVEMATLVKRSIHSSILCLTERNPDFADQVIRDEELVNRSEIAVDDMAIRLVSLNQPVASDMRFLIAALKINTDLERMGDLSVNTARRARALIGAPPLDPAVPIPALSALVEDMVERSINAFAHKDAELARGVLLADDEVDQLRSRIYEDLAAAMEAEPRLVRCGLEHMFIARNLERTADHATNIAEDVIFLAQGIDVRHHNET
jgi:phosphate transport system protein